MKITPFNAAYSLGKPTRPYRNSDRGHSPGHGAPRPDVVPSQFEGGEGMDPGDEVAFGDEMAFGDETGLADNTVGIAEETDLGDDAVMDDESGSEEFSDGEDEEPPDAEVAL